MVPTSVPRSVASGCGSSDHRPRLVVGERLVCSVALQRCLKVGRALPVTVDKMENICRAGALLLVGFGQLGPSGRASDWRTRRTKSPPLGDCSAEAGYRAVDRLILQIEVHAVGAVEDGTRDVWWGGVGRRGDVGGRRIGDCDTGRHVADAGRHHRGHGNLSLKAAFVGERGAGLHAAKRAVGLWLQRPRQHDGIRACDDLTVGSTAARLVELALNGRGLPVTLNETVTGRLGRGACHSGDF
jgi:hypothetical protein